MRIATLARPARHWLWIVLALLLSGLPTATGSFAAPAVTSSSPADGATGVPVTATIRATFSEPVDPSTVTGGSIVLSLPVRAVAIDAGYNFTVMLRENGTVSGWGYNGSGQTSVPEGLGVVSAIAAGRNHVLALQGDGKVIAWGENGLGQATVPEGLSGVIAIAAGESFSLALKDDATVVAWGDNSRGQTTVPGGLGGISRIAAGSTHVLALKSDGTIAAWGDNTSGKTMVPAGLGGVIALAAGYNHSVALKSDGTVVAWGANNRGQVTVPAGLSGVVAIAAGLDYTMALKDNGSVVAWGDNSFGQTVIPAGLGSIAAVAGGYNHAVVLKDDGMVVSWGDNSCSQTTLPAGISGVVAAAAGDSHTLALKSDGSLFAWGNNNSGQASIPAGFPTISAIAAGNSHTLALDVSGRVIAFGNNSFGQTSVPAGLSGVSAVAAGDHHSVALKNDGTVMAWGLDSSGQSTVPPGLTTVTRIAAGAEHTLALKQDGTVAAWGSNSYGETTPPAGLTGITAIAAAGYHSVALKGDGSVVAWGENIWGQSSVPAGLDNVMAIAAGPTHTVALKNDGTLVAWGANNLGQCDVPDGLSGIIGIAAGNGYTIAIRNDGTMAGWGDNRFGQSTIPEAPYWDRLATVVSYDTGDDSASVIPTAPLPLATRLTAIVNRGIRSLDGTHAAADYSWDFTTETSTVTTTASPAGGTYPSPQSVMLTASAPATIYYTTSGAAPTMASAVYSGPIPVSASTTLQFFSVDQSGHGETPKTEIYTIGADTTPPLTTPSPAGGTYNSALTVTLSASEPATIYYTTNGATPTVASPVYTGAIPVYATTTLRFFARDLAENSEPVKSSVYILDLDTTPPATTASPPGGTYDSALDVTLSANEPATIYYTTSGATPTTASAVYTGAIPVSASTTLRYFAIDPAGNSEQVETSIYTIRQNQTISFTPLPASSYGDPSFTLEAIASSGLPVTFTSSDTSIAMVSGNRLTIVAAGSAVITASQGGDGIYNPAAAITRTLTINKAPLTVTADNTSRLYGEGNPDFSATYSGFVNGETQAALSGAPDLQTAATASSPVGSYPITAAAGTLSSANYSFIFASGTLTVDKAAQAITFAPLPTATFGDPAYVLTATSSSGLPVSYSSSDESVAIVNGSGLTIVAAGSAIITASQDGDGNYNAALSVARQLTVDKAMATVTLEGLSATYNGTPKEVTATTVPPGLAITLTYDGVEAAPTAAGNYSISALVSDPNFQGSASGTLTIAKADQTIDFSPLPDSTYGDAAFDLTATAASGLPVAYTSSNGAVAIVNGSSVTIVGAGTTVITAIQNGDTNYNAAPAVARTLTVNKAQASVTFGPLNFTYDGNPKPVTATTLPAGLSVSITYDGSATPPTEVGKYTVVATVEDANYQGSTTATEEIAKKSQTITFDPLPEKTYGDAPFTISASASSKLNLVFEYDPAIVTIVKQGQKYLLTIVGAGTTVITATQPGNRNYSEAPPVSQTLVVNKAGATVTLGSTSFTYDGSPKGATATTSPAGLAVTFTYNGSATPPVDAGSYNLVASVDDANYQGSASGILTIARASQAITFAPLPAGIFGSGPFSPGAFSSSGLTISYTSSNPAVATVSGTNVTIVGVGTTVITARQDGDGNHLAAAAVTQTLTVGKGEATVTLGSLSAVYNGTQQPATATTLPAGLEVTITYDGFATAPVAAGDYQVTATVNSPNYQGNVSGTLTIARASQTITFALLPAKTFGDAPFSPGATASSGLAVSYSSSNPAVASISGTTVTIVGVGTTVITASQPGDGNHVAASPVTRTLTVNAPPVTGGKTAVTMGGITSYHNTLADACAAVTSGTTAVIRLQAMTFAETLTINNSNATVSIIGGYDSGFNVATGMSTIQGGLVINSGTLIADRLVIM